MRGVDVSSYQGVIDWTKAKAAGVEFAILKIIRRDLKPDKEFENNWNGCIQAGIPIQGVYNYSYATTVTKAITDAHRVLEVIGNDRHPMVWLDWEDGILPKGKLAAEIINAYGDVITSSGCQFGIYFGMSYYSSCLDNVVPYIKPEYRKGWEARYYNGYKDMAITDEIKESKKPSHFDGSFYGWQYSSSGIVDGIKGRVDLNIWYTDIEAARTAIPEEKAAYQLSDFIRESRSIWGVLETASAAEIVARTVTISTAKNKSHAIVTSLERYMQALGYYTGKIEADSGQTPLYGNGMKKAIILYQTNHVKTSKKNQDGILTAGAATWKQLYGMKTV